MERERERESVASSKIIKIIKIIQNQCHNQHQSAGGFAPHLPHPPLVGSQPDGPAPRGSGGALRPRGRAALAEAEETGKCHGGLWPL